MYGQAHLLTSLIPLLSHMVRPDMLAVPAGQMVSLVSAISLLGGGIWYQDRTAVVAALLMGIAKICDGKEEKD